MNGRTKRLAAGLGGLLATAAFGFGIVQAALAEGDDSTRAAEPTTSNAPALPMEQVLADLKAQGYGEVYEIERERDKYEVKAKNSEGQMVELHLDARTGKPLEIEEDDND